MAKTRKRRVNKTRPHQSIKTAESAASNSINWTRILVITIGIVIVLSMVLSLVHLGN
jgi:CHASE3 domain sensor protein